MTSWRKSWQPGLLLQYLPLPWKEMPMVRLILILLNMQPNLKANMRTIRLQEALATTFRRKRRRLLQMRSWKRMALPNKLNILNLTYISEGLPKGGPLVFVFFSIFSTAYTRYRYA